LTYLDDLAADIAHRVAPGQVPDDGAAPLFRLYALLALVKGADVTAADVHDAWAVWMRERNPEHPSLKPFDELDPATQRADEPFVEAIRMAVAGRGDALTRHG
jgi:hypothetical protein